MKRFLLTTILLITGVALGAGGFYVASNWEKLDPFRKPDAKEPLLLFTTQLRKACATEEPLRGSIVRTVELANGKLALRGVVARQEQIALLQAKGQALLEQYPDLKTQCAGEFAIDGMKVAAVLDQLSGLQADFDAGRGAEGDDGNNPAKRDAMRTTRLDAVSVTDDGQLTFTGVCVRGNTRTEATQQLLVEALQKRYEALGVPPSSMPVIAVDLRFFPSPAAALQKQLAKHKDIHLTSAWYDAKGMLHVAGLVGSDADRKVFDKAWAAYATDPQTRVVVKAPAASPNFTLHMDTFQPESRVLKLQKQWVEHARKENKPNLRHIALERILPIPLNDDKKQVVTDDEGNIRYHFRVKGRLLETAGDRASLAAELTAWLTGQLPKVPNPDRRPIAPKLVLDVKENPIFALQHRIIQRGLDGAVITDALFDEKGHIELTGRLHQADDSARQLLEVTVRDTLGSDFPWHLRSLKSHESAQDGQPLAWFEAVRRSQARLAQDPLGQRVRLDRLYFAYDGSQLRLVPDGVFLTDGPKENLDAVLAKAVDDVIASRDKAALKTAALNHIPNPLTSLQNLTAERADLDGVLFTGLRFGPDGQLRFDGRLGQPDQKAALITFLTPRLRQVPELLRKPIDAKVASWSIDGLKPYASAKGEVKWSDVVHSWQAGFASASEPALRRTNLCRAYFTYDANRRLALNCSATYLARPKQSAEEAGLKQKLEQKLDAISKRLLSEVAIEQLRADVREFDSPIFELQKQAVAKKYDGLLFLDAFYGGDGKLRIDGLRGNADQVKHAKELLDQLLADKERTALAPAGVAPLDGLKLVAWQPLLNDIRTQFAGDKASLFKQTRIDRAYFQYDKTGARPVLHFDGVCIYTGNVQNPDAQFSSLADTLKVPLKAKGIDAFALDLSAITRLANPVYEMQRKARDNQWDGIVFAEIGFDAKGACVVTVPFAPQGQQANIRTLIDEAAKKHPKLGPIGLR